MLAEVAAAVDAATVGKTKRLDDIRDFKDTDRSMKASPVSRAEFGDPESDMMSYGADVPWI